MKIDKNKILIIVFIILEFLLALLCLACGIWLNASSDMHAYMQIFVLTSTDETLLAAAGIMLCIGVILPLVCVLGAVCVFKESWGRFFIIFIALLPIFIILGFIAGFLPIGLRYDIHRFVKNGMRDQLNNHYTPNNTYSRAWNRVQVKKRCCGIDGAWDYQNTNWFANMNTDLVSQSIYVPDSCCVLNFNQDRELYWVDPENLQVKDKVRCNEDAWGYIDKSANVNTKGCFAALFFKNPDLLFDQSIWTIMDVITGVCLTTAIFSIIVMVVGILYMKLAEVGSDQQGKTRY